MAEDAFPQQLIALSKLGKREYTLDEVYAFERHLGDLYPGNQNVKPKILSSFNLCATGDSSSSHRACDPKRPAWPGFSTVTNVIGAGASLAMTVVRANWLFEK
jgi:hypothetical protein